MKRYIVIDSKVVDRVTARPLEEQDGNPDRECRRRNDRMDRIDAMSDEQREGFLSEVGLLDWRTWQALKSIG